MIKYSNVLIITGPLICHNDRIDENFHFSMNFVIRERGLNEKRVHRDESFFQ